MTVPRILFFASLRRYEEFALRDPVSGKKVFVIGMADDKTTNWTAVGLIRKNGRLVWTVFLASQPTLLGWPRKCLKRNCTLRFDHTLFALGLSVWVLCCGESSHAALSGHGVVHLA
jgi:hypothetical protein